MKCMRAFNFTAWYMSVCYTSHRPFSGEKTISSGPKDFAGMAHLSLSYYYSHVVAGGKKIRPHNRLAPTLDAQLGLSESGLTESCHLD